MKRSISLVLVIIMVMSIAIGCSSRKEETSSSEKEETSSAKKEETSIKQKDVTLKFLIMDESQYEYYSEKNNLSDVYNKVKPNVNIEFELAKDSEQYLEMLQIRNSADELPDLMVLKPYMLAKFKGIMALLNDTDAAKNNIFAGDFAVDGNIIGIPERSFGEFIYYRKSIFDEYELEVPKTWDEFINTALKIKEKGEYIKMVPMSRTH